VSSFHCLSWFRVTTIGSENKHAQLRDLKRTRKTKMRREDTCERVENALRECHRRIPAGPSRDSACRHLSQALAMCLVSSVCPEQSEAVRTLCSTAGTALKRRQCQQAQFSLSLCLSSHQQ